MFNHGQNGKGSRDRTTDRPAYLRNIVQIDLPGKVAGLDYVGGGRYRKRYGL